MANQNLTFNVLTFNHPTEELTFYFTNTEKEGLCRLYKTLVPAEVIEEFGEQDYYYTSFANKIDGFLPITKKCKPDFNSKKELSNEEWKQESNAAFKRALLKRHYNAQIHIFFKAKGDLVKPHFIKDTEIWLPIKKSDIQYNFYEKFTIKVQLASITEQPELLITYAGISKVFRKSITDLMPEVPPSCFNWVIFQTKLFKYDELPEEAKKDLNSVYPVWNFELRDALLQETETPDRSNKYIKFKSSINKFFKEHLNTTEFKAIIPLNCESFITVPDLKINKVKDTSNQLLFANNEKNVVPYIGMSKGPFKTSNYSKIQFFFIFHEDDFDIAMKLDNYFKEGLYSFKGLYNFAKVPYFTEPKFSIRFKNRANPLPEIENIIYDRNFQTETHYIAIYLSPHSKHVSDKTHRSVYYKIKELLLLKGVTSQAIESDKLRTAITKKTKYDYSLNNIAIAILAKLNGIPWQLNTKLKNELIVGVGAFKNMDTEVQYIGSAFSFANDGKFNCFECFQKNQTIELAGSIIRQIKEYVSVNSNISRLIIHFFKNMSNAELRPIEKGLEDLGLDIPVFILSINKTESHDIVAFDNDWKDLMPHSGTFINIGYNRFLLFNNTRYNNGSFNPNDGYPFPIKLSIRCSDQELAKDFKTIKELIDQVYQFSRMYWKSVRQQNLPVTIKYPEMVAEIFPHFDGNEIPTFGKDNLWFL